MNLAPQDEESVSLQIPFTWIPIEQFVQKGTYLSSKFDSTVTISPTEKILLNKRVEFSNKTTWFECGKKVEIVS